MSKIKKTQLADLLKVSRAAITKAVGSGLLVSDDGLIDLENPVNKYYIAAKGIILSEFEDNNMPKKKEPSEKKIITVTNMDLSSEKVAEYTARKKKADAEHAELKNQKMRGELLDAQLVSDLLFLFLDKVANNLQRNASAFLGDVANRIITEGALTSSIRNQWMNMVLEQFDIAKKEMIKRIDQIKDKQNG
jgi:phage terminase Nu1 subunit (DNA packaging protein)